MLVVFVVSFQGPNGGLTFPTSGVSLRWFEALFAQERTGDIAGALARSLGLSVASANFQALGAVACIVPAIGAFRSAGDVPNSAVQSHCEH